MDVRIEKLAEAFRAEMRDEISEDDRRAADYGNVCDPDRSVCHSHDYCDSNEVMDAAWSVAMDEEWDCGSGDHASLVNAAWNLAKERGFAI